MASLVLSGDTSGSITVAAPAVAGSTTQTLVNVTGTLAPVVSGTAQASTSGTSIDFTSIPSWVKRITVMFNGVSTNGSSVIQIQIGTSGGVETTNYVANASIITSVVASAAYTSGFGLVQQLIAGDVLGGSITISLVNSGANTWAASGNFGYSVGRTGMSVAAGVKSLSATLDRVRITTVNGTDTFDAGTINILYE
jgi:hypothetical protein